jgi:hypothetical protein
MRLLLVGAQSDYAIERPYLNHLSAINEIEHIELFRAQNQFLDYYKKSLLNKIFYRVGLSTILNEINQALKLKIEEVNPHAIFIFKGMEIFPSTLKWIRSKNIKLVSYNPDNPFIFSGKGSGNSNITDSIGLYDLHFTYDLDVKKKIEEHYKLPVEILPFGFDIPTGFYETVSLQHEVDKVCFVGSPDVHRANFINQLADRNVQIDVYGNNWKGFCKSKRIQTHDAVYGDVFWQTLQRYRIQLNLMRPHNLGSHNMRTFEIPGIGGIQLAPQTNDHETFFEPNSEIFLFKGVDDCANQVNRLLASSFGSSIEIRRAARKRSLDSGYSYQARAQHVFETIRRLLNEQYSYSALFSA